MIDWMTENWLLVFIIGSFVGMFALVSIGQDRVRDISRRKEIDMWSETLGRKVTWKEAERYTKEAKQFCRDIMNDVDGHGGLKEFVKFRDCLRQRKRR